MRKVSIVGAGRLGGALALALDSTGIVVDALFYRGTEPSPELTSLFHHQPRIAKFSDSPLILSGIILITTQDAEIESASARLVGHTTGTPEVFITSGALSSTSIGHLRNHGCKVGSIHPLVSISDPILGAKRFKNAYFCLEGDPEAIETSETIVRALGGHFFSIPTGKKPLYHAAAVTSSGHLVALIDIAIGMLEKCALDRDEAKRVLLPLIESTLDNLKEQSLEESLTGTFARGDAATFARHLDSLRKNVSRDEIETFLNLGSRSIEIARRIRSNAETLDELRDRVLMAKKTLR